MAGRLRIIGGRWRGRKLQVPERPGLRPTGDRARETLFNWLQGLMNGARCVDLFAGTGALGLEAASRGASRVVLVEQDRRLCERLRTIGDEWPGGEVLRVVQADATHWLERAEGPFDIAFVDPPFSAGLHGVALQALARPGLLAAGAMVYVESDARSPAPVAAPEVSQDASSPPGSGACRAGAQAHPPIAWRIERQREVGEVRMQLLGAPDPSTRADTAFKL